MSWSLNVGTIRVGDLEETLNEAIATAPTEMFALEEQAEQVAALVKAAGTLIDDGVFGVMDDDDTVAISMVGHADEGFAEGETRTMVTLNITRV